MSPDRTAPTTLRPSHAQRAAAPAQAAPDGFAALLGAVDQAAAGRTERRDRGDAGSGDRPGKGGERGDRHDAVPAVRYSAA